MVARSRGPSAGLRLPVPGGRAAALPPRAGGGCRRNSGAGHRGLPARPAGRGLRSAFLCYGGTGFRQNSC